MGTVYLHGNGGSGGSGGMGLTIVVGTDRPTKATHNTLWVYSDVEAPMYSLSAVAPETPEPGVLWIPIGSSGRTKIITSVGDNWITVYIISVQQYIDGKWVEKTAKVYQNGEWIDVITDLYFVKNGVSAFTFSLSGTNKQAQYDGYYGINGGGSGYHSAWIPNVNLRGYTALRIEGTFRTGTGYELCVWDKATAAPDYNNHTSTVNLTESGATLNVSELNGIYSIGITNSSTYAMKIVNMWLE